MEYKVLRKDEIFKNQFLTIDKTLLSIDTFHKQPIEIERYGLRRSNVVGALVYIPLRDELLFVEQFRYATVGTGSGWILEVVAGVIEGNDDPEVTVRREILEEVGYEVTKVQEIAKFYTSPGFSDQYTYFYYAQTDPDLKVTAGGGLAEEDEDLRVHALATKEVWKMLAAGEFCDAMTIAALQHFFLFLDPKKSTR